MRAVAEVINVDQVEVSITLTGTIKFWRDIREQLGDKWPAIELSRAIRDVTFEIERRAVFTPPEKE